MEAGDRVEDGAGTGKKRKEATASDAGAGAGKKKILPKWRMCSIPCEGSEVLKRKKEATAVRHLWASRDVLAALDRCLDEQEKAKAEEEAEFAAGKKRKKVAKNRIPNALIEHMMRDPFKRVPDFSEEELAKRSASYRQLHDLRKFIDGKMFDYEQTLIDQDLKQGYAEDETEVSEDDE